jgi:hypothetical protein
MVIASALTMSKHRASAEIAAGRQRLPAQGARDVMNIVQLSVAAFVFSRKASARNRHFLVSESRRFAADDAIKGHPERSARPTVAIST